jgi:ABC-type branched-subunit amino acid transport system substrate-binding protein
MSGCTNLSPVVKIGLVGPFEGRNRDIGYDVIYSARLAVRQINELGGIGKYRIALVAQDDFGDPEVAQQIAETYLNDPQVVAVIGHWLPETSNATQQVYEKGNLPFVNTSMSNFGAYDSEALPTEFLQAYENITPFEESAGQYAGGAYDAMNFLLEAMKAAQESEGTIDRESVSRALNNLQYQGMTGIIESN